MKRSMLTTRLARDIDRLRQLPPSGGNRHTLKMNGILLELSRRVDQLERHVRDSDTERSRQRLAGYPGGD